MRRTNDGTIIKPEAGGIPIDTRSAAVSAGLRSSSSVRSVKRINSSARSSNKAPCLVSSTPRGLRVRSSTPTFSFELTDLATQCRLGNVQGIGRPRDTAQTRHGHELPE